MQDLRRKARNLKVETRAFIDGAYCEAQQQQAIDKVSPVDGEVISSISACAESDVNAAVDAAQRSFYRREWLDLDVQEKKAVCFRLADLMEANQEELALLDTLETGRAYRNFIHDSIPKAIEALRYFTEAVDKIYGYALSQRKGVSAQVSHEALGVVGLITPWNDPLVVSMWKLAPALLMGNSVVLKPAEQSTYSILKIASLASQAGLPKGVLNVIPGYGDVAGKALALHNDVRGIFFTGSSEVGKKILAYSGASNMKKVGLECGGKSPFIISKHCGDIKKAASVLAKNIFYNQGQICSAPSRVFVDSEVKAELMSCLRNEIENYVPDDPFDMGTIVGCMVSKEQQQKVLEYVEQGKRDAVDYITPVTENRAPPGGASVAPIIFEFDNLDSVLIKEEIFGPVLSVVNYNAIDEALKLANQTRFGLAAAIWTDDLKEAHELSDKLEAGIVHVNSYGDDDNSIPFGGIKESGIGKDKSLFAFHEYSYLKSKWIGFGS